MCCFHHVGFTILSMEGLYTKKLRFSYRNGYPIFQNRIPVPHKFRLGIAKYYSSGILPEETKVPSRLPPITGSEEDKKPQNSKDFSIVAWLERGAWIGLACLILVELYVHLVLIKDWLPKSSGS
ncbi:uncharacterized protein Gasu_53690 [Galdieria sulphuraria]|uniref:Uncharacterized protein n=1 Tax=Galdieria sulphuraria TaxID=130081 RepID=M2XAW2_GALSU|nr:uncharacterized protein Gasu_53690 [Galdieria sulphuraria]EME27032.1 hypothetical protein Gasu_53690 [Galdieria sulphuraria]|eukprot:XP_005703552.1 hypothetical protein Gasu_53690 [Galdieria sulphuraria]